MLELNHVGYTTEDGMEILHDITLKIDERFVAVTGPNGGGKSTLAKVIAGIYQPTKGSILLDGVDITNMSITDRGRYKLCIPAACQIQGIKGKRFIEAGSWQWG